MNLELKSCPKCKQGVDMRVIRHLDSDADMCLVVGCLEDGHPELYGTLSDFELTLVDIGVEAPDLAERWNALPREEKPKQRFVEVPVTRRPPPGASLDVKWRGAAFA